MNLKKLKVISTISIFLLMFPFHFVYDIFPNSITSIFFPVNESIWEHMKLIYTSYVFYSIFEYIILQKSKILYHNFLFSINISSIFNIIIFLLIYLPINSVTGHNFPIILIVLIITISISQYISYQILKKNNIKYLNTISLMLIIINYIIFGYLTYFPIRTDLFYDFTKDKYGINTYLLGTY